MFMAGNCQAERHWNAVTRNMAAYFRNFRHFNSHYREKNVSVQEVKDVVKKKLDGTGRLLGYGAMHRKVRQVHDLNVPRDLVHAAMYDLDPKGLKARGPEKENKSQGKFCNKIP